MEVDRRTMNHRVIATMISEIAKSGVRTAIYIAPPNPTFVEDEKLGERIAAINAFVGAEVSRHDADNLEFWVLPDAPIETDYYRDSLHLNDATKLEGLLLPLVKASLADKKRE